MYQPEQLRSFLAVAQSLSFTASAAALGIRQSTISQHVRRLEEQTGRQLFIRDTRNVRLTADGEAMVGFSRAILAAHEQAAGYFAGSQVGGRLRFGVTDDLALSRLPRILRDFRQLYPRIDLDLSVAQNGALVRRLESGHLDMAFVKRAAGAHSETRSELVRRDALIWAAAEGTRVDDSPVDLVVYQAPSLSRSIGVESLEREGRGYRITCIARGVNGVIAAVRAGMGVAVFARSLMPDDLVELSQGAGLPELPNQDLVLMTNPRSESEATSALASAILASTGALRPNAELSGGRSRSSSATRRSSA